ncbi:MAG TPA: TadE/TadG family type IV pilus assembly protein [Roseiarcus sp.]|nr:TadE/TadG family type IV pilus assembly protein [Roseiarcus sp.]
MKRRYLVRRPRPGALGVDIRGAAAIEFAMIAPALILLLFGIVEDDECCGP